jgi:hypothetical protein
VPALPVTVIYRRVCQLAKGVGDVVPSYDVVYEVVRQIPADLLTLALKERRPTALAFRSGKMSIA